MVMVEEAPGIMSCVAESQDEDIHRLQQYLEEQRQEYGGSEYNINWEEVGEGRSSGMPGKWVSL